MERKSVSRGAQWFINREFSYHGDKSTDKLEIVQVIRIDVRRWVDLKAVIVLVCVLEQAVHGV